MSPTLQILFILSNEPEILCGIAVILLHNRYIKHIIQGVIHLWAIQDTNDECNTPANYRSEVALIVALNFLLKNSASVAKTLLNSL